MIVIEVIHQNKKAPKADLCLKLKISKYDQHFFSNSFEAMSRGTVLA